MAGYSYSTPRIVVTVKGDVQLRNRLGRIANNIPKGSQEVVDKMINEARDTARQIIQTSTSGEGNLANSLAIERIETGGNGYQTRLFVPNTLRSPRSNKNYGVIVHEGWAGNWAPFEGNQPLQAWLRKNNPKLYNYGLKKGYVWMGPRPGLKYFDIAFANVASKTPMEINRMLQKFLVK